MKMGPHCIPLHPALARDQKSGCHSILDFCLWEYHHIAIFIIGMLFKAAMFPFANSLRFGFLSGVQLLFFLQELDAPSPGLGVKGISCLRSHGDELLLEAKLLCIAAAPAATKTTVSLPFFLTGKMILRTLISNSVVSPSSNDPMLNC